MAIPQCSRKRLDSELNTLRRLNQLRTQPLLVDAMVACPGLLTIRRSPRHLFAGLGEHDVVDTFALSNRALGVLEHAAPFDPVVVRVEEVGVEPGLEVGDECAWEG
jgi:hypothetical protein